MNNPLVLNPYEAAVRLREQADELEHRAAQATWYSDEKHASLLGEASRLRKEADELAPRPLSALFSVPQMAGPSPG